MPIAYYKNHYTQHHFYLKRHNIKIDAKIRINHKIPDNNLLIVVEGFPENSDLGVDFIPVEVGAIELSRSIGVVGPGVQHSSVVER